ncbi:MAG: hypothetical protein Unbinned3907contig1000_47 [Prokaryotic dsDNA virus sp.]|nr:MAG: hypothetical protein Unbinned3907contig1000_47 [Prokaryotic dsDNA virus sp.]|tara:strand:- start:16958 stop:17614 length:657 start_codon:yes stop_codon:yes gene_type:complete
MKAKIKVPTDLNDISLGQYQMFDLLTKDIEGVFLDQRTVEIFCGISFAEVALITHKDVKEVAEDIRELLSGEVEFKHRFKIKTQEFGFIPDFENITSGEFADLTSYVGKIEEMHKTMAILFRPITNKVGDKYDIYPYTGTKDFSDLMKFMPLGIALGSMVFFWNLANDLKNDIQSSTREEAIQVISTKYPTLTENGVFTEVSTPLLKVILEGLTKSVN